MDMSIERYVFQIDTPKVHSTVSSEQTERPSFKSELIKSELNLRIFLKKTFQRFAIFDQLRFGVSEKIECVCD